MTRQIHEFTAIALMFALTACSMRHAKASNLPDKAAKPNVAYTEDIVIVIKQEEAISESTERDFDYAEKSPPTFDTRYYTYDGMAYELRQIAESHEDIALLNSLGETVDGRDVLCLRLGKQEAPHSIIITGSIHGREYLTSELIMKQIRDIIQGYDENRTYKNRSYQNLLSLCAIYIVPMVNPDGVSISQFQLEGLHSKYVRDSVRYIAKLDGGGTEYYYRRWKSNAEGIDLNRQFEALWESYNDNVGHPSANHYKGEAPGCTVEAKALINLTEEVEPDRTISYHTAGNVIYWYFGQTGELKDRTKSFADRIFDLTGYPLDASLLLKIVKEGA